MNTATQQKAIKTLHNIIEKFKDRSDVVNGNALGWKPSGELVPTRENRPFSIGDGLTTTGWCVSASEAFLKDVAFQSYLQIYGAHAKLISIDIKEQYHGYCFNGSQNKWHTAIMLNLDGLYYVVDLTCGQFGSDYVGKNVWTINAWTLKFRSPLCKHNILVTDNNGNENNLLPTSKHSFTDNEILIDKYNLSNYTTLDDGERNLLLGFAVNLNKLNNKLLSGTATKDDLMVIETVIEIYKTKMYQEFKILNGYTSLEFNNKSEALNWLDAMVGLNENPKNKTVINFQLKQNLLLFESVDKAKRHFQITDDSKYIVNLEFNNVTGFKGFSNIPTYFLFMGTILQAKMGKDFIVKFKENESLIKFNGI